jgi:hypothetical protein
MTCQPTNQSNNQMAAMKVAFLWKGQNEQQMSMVLLEHTHWGFPMKSRPIYMHLLLEIKWIQKRQRTSN